MPSVGLLSVSGSHSVYQAQAARGRESGCRTIAGAIASTWTDAGTDRDPKTRKQTISCGRMGLSRSIRCEPGKLVQSLTSSVVGGRNGRKNPAHRVNRTLSKTLPGWHGSRDL